MSDSLCLRAGQGLTTPRGPSCPDSRGGLGSTSELAARSWMATLTGLSTDDGFRSYFVLVSLLWVLSPLERPLGKVVPGGSELG